MRELSFELLNRELRKIASFPLFMMAFIFVIAVAGLLQREHRSRTRQIEREFLDAISWNENFIAQVVFQNHPLTITTRLQNIANNWAKRHPEIQGCLRISIGGTKISQCSNPEEGFDWDDAQVLQKKINWGTIPVATLDYAIVRKTSLTDILPPSIIMAVLLSLSLAAIFQNFLVKKVSKQIISPLFEEIKRKEREIATTETVQIIAHDIKRPFVKIRRILRSSAAATKNKDSWFKFAKEILPSVEQNMDSVEAMLGEVIEMGMDMPVSKEELIPIELINDALTENFHSFTHADIELVYDLAHEHKVLGDREKLMRVFLNIIENATLALGEKGTIWIKTRETTDGTNAVTEFCIGNDGPAIALEDQRKLFGLFFKRRSNGHGLGLAIAKKIITSHGGRIWCESSERIGTEFYFTLPTARSEAHTKIVLKLNSFDFTRDTGKCYVTPDNREPVKIVNMDLRRSC